MISRNVDEAYAPLRIINWLAGLRIFEYPTGKTWPVLSLLYLLILLSVSSTATYYRTLWLHNIVNPLESVLEKLFIYVNVISIGLASILGWCRNQVAKHYFRRLKNVDLTLGKLGASSICYTRMYYMTIIFTVLLILHEYAYMHLKASWLSNWMNFRCALFISWPIMHGSCIRGIIILDYCINVRFMGCRFRQANNLLRSVVSIASKVEENPPPIDQEILEIPEPTTEIPAVVKLSHRDSEMKTKWRIKKSIQAIKQVHLELTCAAKNLCAMFGLQVSLEMALMTMQIVSLLFRFYNRITQYDLLSEHIRLQEVILTLTVCCSHAFKLALVNHVSEVTCHESKMAQEVIHSFAGSSFDHEVQREIEQFALQLTKCQLRCSAYGFFSLGHGFLRGLLGTITTYLVIMIEMCQVLNTNMNISLERNSKPNENDSFVITANNLITNYTTS